MQGPNPTEPANLELYLQNPSLYRNQLEKIENLRNLDPFEKFMYLYPAEASKDTAKRRLRMFLDFVQIEGSNLKDRCNIFAEKAKKRPRMVRRPCL